jgi:hypothetical protein
VYISDIVDCESPVFDLSELNVPTGSQEETSPRVASDAPEQSVDADAIVSCSGSNMCKPGETGAQCPDWCTGKAGPVGQFKGAEKGQYYCDDSMINGFGAQHWCLNNDSTHTQFNTPAKGCAWMGFKDSATPDRKLGEPTAAQMAAGITSLGFAHSRDQAKNLCGQCFLAVTSDGTNTEVQLVMGVDQNGNGTWPGSAIFDWADYDFMHSGPSFGNDSPYGKLFKNGCGSDINCNSPSKKPSQQKDAGQFISVYISGIVDCNNPKVDLSGLPVTQAAAALLI